MKAEDKIVPEQQSGKAIDAHTSIELENDQAAKRFFAIVQGRLADVNQWHTIAENISAEFKLMDKSGNILNRVPEKGDYFRIDIPGPGSKAGEGYDWVQIEQVLNTHKTSEEAYGFRVRPAVNPLNETGDTAHFYAPQSTSTFLVTRSGSEIKAEIFDRNTKPNDETDTTADMIRSAVVGIAGLFGFSKIQWKGLAEGLLKK
jgi:hypothetical protein